MNLSSPEVALRTCLMSCCDLKGIEHSVEVTADSPYEAVAQGFRVFRETIGSMKSAVARGRSRWWSDSPRLSTDYAEWQINVSYLRRPGGIRARPGLTQVSKPRAVDVLAKLRHSKRRT